MDRSCPTCPTCRSPLVDRRRGGWGVSWCARCEGVWLGAAALAEVERRSGRGALLSVAEGEDPWPERVPPCAVCGAAMSAWFLGREAGIVVRACPRHGVWIDGDDLLHIAAFIQEGGLEWSCSPEREHLALAAAFEPVFELLGCR